MAYVLAGTFASNRRRVKYNKYKLPVLFDSLYSLSGGPGSVVGTATSYGLDGLGIESRWGGEIFRTCPDRVWGPPSLLYNGYRVFSERVELYLYSPYEPYGLYRASVPVQG